LVSDASQLALYENGSRVLAQITPRAWWHPNPESSLKWVTLDFLAMYEGGRPRDYRLKLVLDSAVPPPSEAKLCEQTADAISVDTGAVAFVVNRKRFRGIEKVRFDRHGNRDVEVVPEGMGGPYIVDQSGMLFEAANDEQPQVVVEEQGPVR